MKDRDATRAIRELAERQHGVIARWQLLELGASEGLIQCRSAGGMLIPAFHGTFTLGQRRLTRQGRWMAAVLASGPQAVLSHASAMELWDMRGSRGPIEVLRRTGGVWRRHPEIRLHQTRALPEAHITMEWSIPVTTVERTLLDMAARLDAKQLERSLVAADRTGRVSWPKLQRLVVRGQGKKGIARLRRVAMEVDPRAIDAKSGLEIDFLVLCREFGLPQPQVNVLVGDYLVDFLWSAQKVVVEIDTYRFHGDRPAFESDHERTVALAIGGYQVHRVTDRMLAWDPDQFMNLVRQSLRERTASNSHSDR
jgi:hypothetical protein